METRNTKIVLTVQATHNGTADRILRKAREMFFGRGFIHVTMDELAYELGMSKRTLYEHFAGKKEILREALLQQVSIVRAGLTKIEEDGELDPVEKLEYVIPFISEALPRFSRQFLLDVQRSAPELWEEVDGHRTEMLEHFFRTLFLDGQAKGLFRSDLDLDLFLLLLRTLVQRAVTPEVLARVPFSPAQVFKGIVSVLIRGIVTESGRNRFQQEYR